MKRGISSGGPDNWSNDQRIREDFDAIARFGDRYDSGSSHYDSFLLSAIPKTADRVLEVGCGAGRLTFKVARAGRKVTALDLSPEMISRAKSRCEKIGPVEFACGNFLDALLDPGQFDCIITVATLHHMPAVPALNKMRALLRPGGRLIVHDLRASSGALDDLGGLLLLAYEAIARLLRTGSPLSPRHVRRAWREHSRSERYLTFEEVESVVACCLPGARIRRHWGWRFTVVWDHAA